MQVATGSVTFPMERLDPDNPFTSKVFPRVLSTEVVMTAPIENPVAILTGFDVEFEPSEGGQFAGDGRPFGNLEIQITIDEVSGDTVTVSVTYGLRDWSGDWDDEHAGTINFAVIAE